MTSNSPNDLAGADPGGGADPAAAPEVPVGADVGETDESAGADPVALDVETLVLTLEEVTAERDAHLDDLQRVSAEFANFRKQSIKRQTDLIEHAASGLAEKLLPVLDACDAAISQGADDVAPVRAALLDALQKEGLSQIADADVPFDPERHDAVIHEPADESHPGGVVAEVLRTGYVWKDRVIKPAMVKVRG